MRRGNFNQSRGHRDSSADADPDEIAPRPRFGQGQFRRDESAPAKRDSNTSFGGRSNKPASFNDDHERASRPNSESGTSSFQGRRGGSNLSYVKQVPKFLQRMTQKTETEEEAEHEAKKKEIMRRLEAQGVDGDMPVIEDYYGLLRDDERQTQIQMMQSHLLNHERSERGLGPAQVASVVDGVSDADSLRVTRDSSKDAGSTKAADAVGDARVDEDEAPPFVNGKPVYRKQKRKEGEAEKATAAAPAKKHVPVMPKREPSKGKLSFSLDDGDDDDS